MFDWRAMQRFGLQEKNLPPGSVVLYRQPTVWEAYRWYIVGGISLMFVEMLLIFGLLWQRTRRRRMETELATIYDRLRLAMEAGSAGGWDWAVKSGKNLGFGNAAGLLGLTANEYSSSTQEFWDRVHGEDRGRLQDAMQKARENHTEFDEEFRVVWRDGTVHWLRSRGRYYYAANGEPERMLGISLDTTERKLAGEALSQASRRLIEAQEAERRRIGRDLHDDIGQRVALLAVELQLMQQDPPDSAVEVSRRMGELWKQTSAISTDVQVLSHELHSSRLEYLGMVPAMRSFCEEFSKQQKVEIEFENQDLGGSFPPDVSLCLFRVLQEALHNAMKHSGVRHFKVQLRGTSDEIHLTVSDSGAGFDPEAARKSPGLGLISMKERLHSVKGDLSIESQSKRGSTIHARVPLSSGSDSARAAG
jgi:PAS domain S-box-containing protein